MKVLPLPLLVLRNRRLLLGPGFCEKHRGPWLVWEQALTRPLDVTERNLVATVLPSSQARAAEGQAVAASLSGLGPFRLGRGSGCDIGVDHPSVPRDFGVLRSVGDQWQFEPTAFDDAALGLVSGQRLRAGSVDVVFLTSEDLARHLDGWTPVAA
jgi:hypothetical protein